MDNLKKLLHLLEENLAKHDDDTRVRNTEQTTVNML